jgi:hypothetical protein
MGNDLVASIRNWETESRRNGSGVKVQSNLNESKRQALKIQENRHATALQGRNRQFSPHFQRRTGAADGAFVLL